MTDYNATASKIIDIAERLTQTRGFNAFSYKDLQEEVGVKTSTMHYYFPAKTDLAVAMVDRYIESFMAKIRDIDAHKQSAKSKLTAFGDIFVDVAEAQKLCLCGMLSSDLASIPVECMSRLDVFFRQTENWIVSVLTQAIEEGDLESGKNIENAAAHFLASLEGALIIARTRKENGYTKAVLDEAVFALFRA